MKTIKTTDGQIFYGHELNDLDPKTREKVIQEHAEFLAEIDEDGNYPEEAETVENIEINGYLFYDDGEIIPIVAHVKGNEIIKHTFGKKSIECTIE